LIIHISDPHISNTAFPNSDLNATKFQCSLKEFATLNPKPAFVIVSGDISNMGNLAPDGMYPMVTQYLFPSAITNPGIGGYFIDSEQTIPIYLTPGNHEYWASLSSQQIPISNDTITNYTRQIAPDTDYAVTTDVDPAVKEGSFAAIARSYAIADREIILPTPVNQFYLPPSGSYNAELVKQLSPEMQVKIQNYGTPIGK